MSANPDHLDDGESTAVPPRLRPGVTLDLDAYEPFFTDTAIPGERKRELLETLWAIVVAFVDLGFDLHPVQQVEAGGEPDLSSAFRLMLQSQDLTNGDPNHTEHLTEAP